MKETQERSWMRMNRIILASHGGLSAGMKDTVQMILGELPNLYALATLRDETEPITVAARRLLEDFAAEDAVYIDRKSTRLNSSHDRQSRMPSSA